MLTFEQKCDNFTAILHEAAAALSCLFYEYSGEDNWNETDTLFCENVSGWLVPLDKANAFAKTNEEDRWENQWSDFFVFAEWRQEGSDIKIDFKKYPAYNELEPVEEISEISKLASGI